MRREILKLSAGWVLCAAAWAACGGESAYTRKDLGFEITVPDHRASHPHFVWFAGNTYSGQVEVYNVKENDGLSSFFKYAWNWDQLKGTTVTDIGIVKLDGSNAIKLTVERSSSRTRFYYTVAGARGYVIWMMSRKEDFDAARKEFDPALASFKIIEAK